MSKNKSCYFEVVKPGETLIVVATGEPTNTEFEQVQKAFGNIEECQFVLCRDYFKFIIVPKGADIEVVKEKIKNAE